MFKKHAIQVQVVKKTEGSTATSQTAVPNVTPEEINKIAKDQIQNIAVSVGAVLLVGLLGGAVKDVAVHTAKTKIK